MKAFRKNLKYTALLLGGVMALYSCSKDFGNTNVSPNGSEVPITANLLTNAIARTSTRTGRTLLTNPTLFVQWTSQTQYTDESIYGIGQVSWTFWYANSGPLEDLQMIINLNSGDDTKEEVAGSGSNNNQMAVARIMKAYIFGVVTDMYGDVPYSEALNGKTDPVYDTQESIYKDLINELKEANAQFDGGAAMKGDILFNGDIAQWKRFANSLRLIYALRLSKAYPGASDYAATEFKSAMNDAAGIIETNSNNAYFTHLDNTSYRNPWASTFDGRDDYALSDVFIDTLKAYNDPRIAKYAQTLTDGMSYKGIPYGLTRDLTLQWEANNNNDWSRMGTEVIASTAPNYIITAAQILLARSEAAMLGWTSEDAMQMYNDAIKTSWEQWGVYDAAKYAAYIAAPATAYVVDPMRMISTQRWITLYPDQMFEAWSEWRRTNYPVLMPSAYAVNPSKQIPVRYEYPAEEPTLNGAGYGDAVSRLSNGDTDDSKVWWDK